MAPGLASEMGWTGDLWGLAGVWGLHLEEARTCPWGRVVRSTLLTASWMPVNRWPRVSLGLRLRGRERLLPAIRESPGWERPPFDIFGVTWTQSAGSGCGIRRSRAPYLTSCRSQTEVGSAKGAGRDRARQAASCSWLQLRKTAGLEREAGPRPGRQHGALALD